MTGSDVWAINSHILGCMTWGVTVRDLTGDNSNDVFLRYILLILELVPLKSLPDEVLNSVVDKAPTCGIHFVSHFETQILSSYLRLFAIRLLTVVIYKTCKLSSVQFLVGWYKSFSCLCCGSLYQVHYKCPFRSVWWTTVSIAFERSSATRMVLCPGTFAAEFMRHVQGAENRWKGCVGFRDLFEDHSGRHFQIPPRAP